MRRLLALLVALLFALVLAAPALVLLLRQAPGRALASSLVALAAGLLAAHARRRRLPLELTALLLLPPAVAWGLGEGWGFFVRLRQWDAVAHASGGFAIGALVAPLLLLVWRGRALPAIVGALALAALAGAFWEIGEWLVDALLGSATLGSAGDTVADLAADLGGALAGAAVALAARARLRGPHRRRLAAPYVGLFGALMRRE